MYIFKPQYIVSFLERWYELMITIINDNNQKTEIIHSLEFLCNAALRNKNYCFACSKVQEVTRKCFKDETSYDIMNAIYELDGIKRLYPVKELLQRHSDCTIDDIGQIEFISLYKFRKMMKVAFKL